MQRAALSTAPSRNHPTVSYPLTDVPRVVTYPRLLRAYVTTHCVWFVLYTFLGKGFAYAGWPPLYVGELLLLFALLTIFRTHLLWSLLSTRLGIIMAIFLAWQFVCTVPHVGEYGLDTLRDSVIWGYALFAFVAGALVLRLRGFLRVVLQRFNRFAILYLFIGPAAWLA